MPKKILLADDSITIQKVVELTFSDGDYEVTAVNNGAKAVQKLAEMRPDIILSDIIMPEKNGYEVCEYVKSHPEFRNIPVVLLTGTFEPFDPDRAEKAGCDAVVTKPFESQSLIHKVEELIASAQQSAAAAPAAVPEPEPSPWTDDTATQQEPAGSPFTTASGGFPAAASEHEPYTHTPDIFGAPPASDQFSGETRAFPRMSFDDLQQMTPAPEPPPPPAPEPSPWDEPASPAPFGAEPVSGGDTRAFQKMSFDDFAAASPAPEPEPEPEAESPFGAPPPADAFSGETRAFPRMSFDELQQAATPPAPEPEPEPETPAAAPEPSPWDTPAPSPTASPFGGEDEIPAFGGETRAFPKLSFDDLQQAATPPAPEAPIEPAPWGEPADETPAFTPPSDAPLFGSQDEPAFGGETRAFPKLSFDDFQQGSTPEPEPEPEPEPAPEPVWTAEPVETLWSPASETAETGESFSTAASLPFHEDAAAPPEDLPFASSTTAEPEPEPEPLPAEPAWSPIAAAEAQAEPEEPAVPQTALPQTAPSPTALTPEAPPMAIAARGGELSEDQVDRIARRVVELMSDQIVRNIAWEVIPDLAEMVVKERIRQLESEA